MIINRFITKYKSTSNKLYLQVLPEKGKFVKMLMPVLFLEDTEEVLLGGYTAPAFAVNKWKHARRRVHLFTVLRSLGHTKQGEGGEAKKWWESETGKE